MRPVRVVMRAFGPFAGEQVIDFRELGENRFFLIHGPTGSGKTTVLDAMCYALYGTTTGAERSAEQMRSQFAPDTMPTEVIFDFAIGAECYRVLRRPAQERAKARGTGMTTVAAAATLWRREAGAPDSDDGEPIAVKTREVDAGIVRAVGFDADQFRQVVMLPQGRFRELLSSSSRDREKIMQALFATGRYADVEFELKRRRASIAGSIEDARKLREETLRRAGVASEQELAELAASGVCQREVAERDRDAKRAAAETAATALEGGRTTVARIAQVIAAELALAEAESAVEASRVASDEAASRLALEKARAPELAAAAERVRSLEAMEAAVGEMQTAREQADAALADLGARSRVSETAQRTREDLRERHAQARSAAADEALAATECVRTQAALEAATLAVSAADALDALVAGIAGAAAVRDERASTSASATQAATKAAEDRDVLLALWREGRAGALAATLEAGAPCPVCGSLEHPAPAPSDASAASDDDVAAAEKAVRRTATAAVQAAALLGEAEAALAGLVAEERALRRSCTGAVDPAAARGALEAIRTAADAASERASAASAAGAAVSELERGIAEATEVFESAREAREAASRAVGIAERDLSQAEKQVPEAMREPGALAAALANARTAAAAISKALEAARERSEAAGAAVAAAEATLKERTAALGVAKAAAVGLTTPDLPVLEAAVVETSSARDAAVEEVARLVAACDACTAAQDRLAELDARSGELLARFETVAAIADAATGSNAAKLSFQRYVLGVFLTDVLEAATRRLVIMTGGRYRLHMAAGPQDRRSASGLELEVYDDHTGEDRPVATLSGGEGFLASLSLALGLAEVVESLAGGVHLDTVFVDEGFGTLDEEALETAIDALMELQGRSRLVGIISHVTELQAVVPARLEVTSTPRGSTARFIVP